MDMIHSVLNVLVPLTTLVLLPLLLPPYLLLRLFSYVKRITSKEDVSGKVILITGASSGIGEQLAYEYARRGARLALCGRREDRLGGVAIKSKRLGSPDVLSIPLDISKLDNCERFVAQAASHFGQVDHLVNNAGICPSIMFEECSSSTDLASVMDVNFWGSVNCTRFAISHLKKRKGKIAVIASIAPWAIVPTLSIYNASKAALITFFETLRVELIGSDIRITIATPGLIHSDITSPDFLEKTGTWVFPLRSTEKCAKVIVDSVCKGDRYTTEPSWTSFIFLLKGIYPQLLERLNYRLAIHRSKAVSSRGSKLELSSSFHSLTT